MRHDPVRVRFDLSDVVGASVDSLDAVLDVACEVIAEYGPVPGNSRIERMARYLVYTLAEPGVTRESAGALVKLSASDFSAVRAAGSIAFNTAGRLDASGARQLAQAMVRLSEEAERA